MKTKIIPMILICFTMFLCACGSEPAVEGDELIKKARTDYTNLNSARVLMTNTATNEVEQTFEFKYDEKGFLTYAYEGTNGDEVYAQYNNSMECFTYENGEYEYLQKGDESFGAYTKDSTHPQADEGLLVFRPSAVAEAEVTEENGVTHVHHEYDADKLSTENVVAFTADYYFDSDDNLLYFVETSTLEEDGKTTEHSYKVEITEKNSVEKVENTVEKYKE